MRKLEPKMVRSYKDVWNRELDKPKVRNGNQVTISDRTGVVINVEYKVPHNQDLGILKIQEPTGKKVEYIVYSDHIGVGVIE